MTHPARLIEMLGEIARLGRSGRLLLDPARGDAGGLLNFSRGALHSCRPAGSQPGAPAPPPSSLAGVSNAMWPAGATGAPAAVEPRFEPVETARSAPDGALTAADLAIELARRIADAVWLKGRLQGALAERLRAAMSPPAAAPRAALGAVEGFLLSRADGTLTLAQLIETSPLGEIETLRAVYALREIGMLSAPASSKTGAAPGRLSDLDRFLRKTGASAPRLTPEQQKERDELKSRCRAIAGQDHYAVLGVDRAADESAVRRAYYRLARLYHPDRLIRPHLEDMSRELEGMFAAITEAYNTLSHPTLRVEYDREFSDRTAGRRKPLAQDKLAVARESYLRGRKEAEAGKLFEAIRLYEVAVQNDPSRAEYFHHLGVCQGQNPRWRKRAEENLLSAIRLNPSAARSYLELARVYHKGGLERRARELYEKVLQWEPDNDEALAAVGRGKEAASGGLLGGLFKKE